MYNLLIGGAAGQGIDTTAVMLEKLLKRSGYSVFTSRDFMSRIRGGHNFSLIRFATEPLMSHSNRLDGIIALNDETIELHKDELNENGFILCDASLKTIDPRIIRIDMDEKAKALGNQRVSGSIAVGVILKLFGENTDHVSEVLTTLLEEKYLDINLKAVREGYDNVDKRFDHLQGKHSDDIILSGAKACSLGAIAAGLRFYSAYPMSPSTSVMEYLSSKSDALGIVVEQAEDEIAAINMAIGASYAGACAMTGTSGGGFCLMVEALGLSGIAEVPLVVVNVQRPGPSTGLPTRTEQSDLKFVISASHGEFPRMVIALRNHADAFYQTARAFHLAEKYQIPVVVLSDQYLADSSATVEAFDINKVTPVKAGAKDADISEAAYLRYRYTEKGISPRTIPGGANNFSVIDSDEHDERGWITESAEVRTRMMDKRMKKLDMLREELQEPDFLGPETFEILLVGWGSTYGPISEAVTLLNKKNDNKYAAVVFGDVFPLPQKLLKEKVAIARQVINVEQNATGQLADLVREQTGIIFSGSVLKYDGRQISGEEIAERILRGDLR